MLWYCVEITIFTSSNRRYSSREPNNRKPFSLEKVFKCTCMLADIKDWGEMSIEYKKFFTKNMPARSAFAGSGLALNARVEIECWAVK